MGRWVGGWVGRQAGKQVSRLLNRWLVGIILFNSKCCYSVCEDRQEEELESTEISKLRDNVYDMMTLCSPRHLIVEFTMQKIKYVQF